MKLKERVFEKLDGARGQSFSGESLAEEFGVSRNAIWKAVKNLQKDGFAIEASSNKGYALRSENDQLTVSGIKKYTAFEYDLHVLQSCTSTNDEGKKLAREGAKEWSVVVSEEQTAGRGRYERKFFSPRADGVYCSIVLRPKYTAEETLFLTTSAAVAVCEAIEEISGKRAQIKWVNDVFVEGNKVCGILTEASFDIESGGLQYAVVGIGVNMREGDFPDEIKDSACALFTKEEYTAQTRSKFIAVLLDRFRYYYETIPQRSFFASYKARSFVLGKRVEAVSGSMRGTGVATDLDERCYLKIRFEDGTEKYLSSGEVSIKIAKAQEADRKARP